MAETLYSSVKLSLDDAVRAMTDGPRVEFDSDHYSRIRLWDFRAGHDRYVSLSEVP